MDLRGELSKRLSRTKIDKLADYVGNNPILFKELVNIYLAGPYRVTHYASKPLLTCSLRNPQLLRPHLKTMLDHLGHPGIHNSLKRNTIRMLQFVAIPKPLQGRVLDICFTNLQALKEAIAVKVFSMSVIARFATQGVGRELRMVIEDQLPFSGPAFRSRAAKVLRDL